MGKKDGKSQKIAARAAQWGGGAEMGPMGLMGCDKRVWAMREQRGSSAGAERREQRRGGEAALFPGVL